MSRFVKSPTRSKDMRANKTCPKCKRTYVGTFEKCILCKEELK
tara:strand:- start:299 stop:427 length:129 start_codon:yes stop_codon:yes gene_type:complete